MNEKPIPLSLLAIEYNETIDALAYRLADDEVFVDPATCLRSVHLTTALRLHDEREERRRAAAHRRRTPVQSNTIQDRVQAIARHQAAQRSAGLLDDAADAVAVICGGEQQARMERRGRDWDRLKRATPDNIGFGRTFGGVSTQHEDW